jgi:uncharacterized protein (TIGR00251 family)
MAYLSIYKDGRVLLRLYVQPKSSRNAFTGMHGDSVKLAITAAPVDGKANKAVIRFLASFFKLKKRDIAIKHGLQSRNKSILFAGVDLQTIQNRLEANTK